MDTQKSGVFVISLDALDLNLLPNVYDTRNNKISPLWTRSNLERRSNEYFEFNIKSKLPDEDTKDPPPKLQYENISCPICDIDLPRPFLSIHRKSSRHRANVMIADIAIQRMRQHICNTDNDCVDEIIDSTAYFCPTCVTVMDCKERDAHEKSIIHKNGLIVEKLSNDFLVLYSSSKEDEINKQQIKKDYTGAKTHDNMQINYDFNDITKSVVNDLFSAIEKPSKKASNDKLTDTHVTNTDDIPMDKYLALIKTRCEGVPMFFKAIDDNFVQIETTDGSIVKVADKNFHSFYRLKKKYLQCFLCGVIFKKELANEHKMSETHMNKLTVPLKNKHCVRQIGDTKHCVLCNVLIEDTDFHVLCNKNHDSHLKYALVSDKLSENQLQSNCNINLRREKLLKDNFTKEKVAIDNVSCKVDKTSVNFKDARIVDVPVGGDMTNNEITEGGFEEASNLANKYFCNACNDYISVFRRAKHNKTSKHILNSESNHHYLMREQGDKLICRVCNTDVDNVQKHVLDKEHKKRYDKLLECSCIQNIDNETFKCDACKKIILIRNELFHINTKEHQLKSGVFEFDYESLGNKEQSEDGSDTFALEYHFCDVCNVNVPNYDHNIQEHKNGRTHTRALEKLSENVMQNVDNTPKELENIHYHMEKTEFISLLNCKICHINILNTDAGLKQHLDKAEHVRNYEKLLNTNFVIVKSNGVLCELCAVDVGLKSELMHIDGKKHKKNIEKRRLELANQVGDTKLSATTNQVGDTYSSVVTNKIRDTYSSVATNKLGDAYSPVATNKIRDTNLPATVTKVGDANSSATNNKVGDKNLAGAANKIGDTNLSATNKVDTESVTTIHRDNLTIVNTDEPSTSNRDLVLPPNDIISAEMLVFLKATVNPKEVICKICEVKIPYNEYNIRTHMNGSKHTQVKCKLMEAGALN